MRLPIALLAAVAGVVAFSGPAMAGAPSARVPYGDLNLTTADGQVELQRRLNKAAWKVCMFDEGGDLRTGDEHAACYRDARKEVAVQFARVVSERQLGG
jgi:UrcA family protein